MNKQPTRQRIGITALILSLAVALTGCGASSVAQDSYPGFPPGYEGDLTNVPRANSDNTLLYLTLGGSSSCPSTPTSLTNVDGVLEITIESNTEGPCTADFTITTHEINLGVVPDELVLVFNNGERQTLAVEQL